MFLLAEQKKVIVEQKKFYLFYRLYLKKSISGKVSQKKEKQ